MNFSEDITIGEIAAEDYRSTKIFNRYGIDFCCRGGKTLREAAEEHQIDSAELIRQIEEILEEKEENQTDFNNWSLDILADYIVKTHHKYTEEQTSVLKPYLQKLIEVHGNEHPELNEINTLFLKVAGEMAAHMKKEEIILFPFIKKVVKAQQSNEKLEASLSRMENPVNMMIHDHSEQGENFKQIRKITKNYTLPADACQTYELTYRLLSELEKDLHKHIHLENNILFPKAVELSKTWLIPSN